MELTTRLLQLGGLALPRANLVVKIPNHYPFTDRIGKHDGSPRNNITRLTGEAPTINPTDTYILSDTNAWRVVTGWTAGTANDFHDINGVPIPFTGQQALDAGIGPRLYCGLKGIGGYTVDQDAAENAKIIRTLKVPTYIDTLYYSDFQEMDWSATSE